MVEAASGMTAAALTKQQLLAEIEDIVRTMPPRPTIRHETEENLSWMGRVSAAIEQWNPAKSAVLSKYLDDFGSVLARPSIEAFRRILTLLHQARHDLRMQTVGPLSVVVVPQGVVFDYFEEVRKIIELSSTEAFFIDPYLDAEFVSRYLPHLPSGVTLRLLAREKLPTLLPAVELFVRQSGVKVEVRSAQNFHDRYVIVDRTACYQSGASFKDGGKSAPTTLTQITDAFAAVLGTYENLWSKAKIEP
jgi:hypothetical protein